MILQFLNSHMPKTITKSLKPRKKPVQERSGQTVDAIFEATIQVLLKDGVKNLTTTRVAERAGVSVGTFYQYYPNKEALFFAILERHLEFIGTSVQIACAKSHGRPVDEMMSNLIESYVDSKIKKRDISLAIWEVVTEFSCTPKYAHVVKRVEADITTMLNTLPGARVEKIPFVTAMILSTLGGATKMIMEKGAPPHMVKDLKTSLQIMLEAYVGKALNGSE